MGEHDDRDRQHRADGALAQRAKVPVPGKQTLVQAESSARGVSTTPGKQTLSQRLPAEHASGSKAFELYLYKHSIDLRDLTQATLRAAAWNDPTPDVSWKGRGDRVFGDHLARSFDDERIKRASGLPQLMHPYDVVGEFRTHVTSQGLTTNWSPAFGERFSQLVRAAVKDALALRVGPRYQAALERLETRTPTADDLIPGHPIDPLVISALTLPGIVDITNIAAISNAGPAKLGKVEARWLGQEYPELWNFVQVSPSSATVEDVAATLWADPKKSTMAFAIAKHGELFRIAPSHARQLISTRFVGEVMGTTDTDASAAKQLVTLAGTKIGKRAARDEESRDPAGDPAHPARPDGKGASAKGGKAEPATPEQLQEIERSIGGLLDKILLLVRPYGLESLLNPALVERDERRTQLVTADAPMRERLLAVLQFQHTQLLTIEPMIGPLVEQVRPFFFVPVVPQFDPSPERTKEHEHLRENLTDMLRAAAVSHQRGASTAIVNAVTSRLRRTKVAALQKQQVDLHDGTRQALDSHVETGGGTARADEQIGDAAEAAENRRGGKTSRYGDQKAVIYAGEAALRSRIASVHRALADLSNAADAAGFGDPKTLRKFIPSAVSVPEMIGDVVSHLTNVQSVWDDAERDGTPAVQTDGNAPDDWGDWQGRAAGLEAARKAFAGIAGDEGITKFLREASESIRHQRMLNAITTVAKALLITVVTGMGAARLGQLAFEGLVADGVAVSRTMRIGAVALDIGINASLNSLVQFAQSDGTESPGWAMLENALAEIFTRGLMKAVHKVNALAIQESHALASLPHLSAAERTALLGADAAGLNLVAEMTGGLVTQWAAHRLVSLVHPGEEISEGFASTVLQQGAALGLGRFFNKQVSAWQKHRERLAQSKLEAKALISARDQFYAEATALANSQSPDPEAGGRLLERQEALIKQARAIGEAGTPAEAPRAETPTGDLGHPDAPGKPAQVTTTASPVGAFHGNAQPAARPDEVHAAAVGALARVADRMKTTSKGTTIEVATPGGGKRKIRVVLEAPKGDRPEVARYDAGELKGSGEITVYLSNHASSHHVERALAHEVAEIHHRLHGGGTGADALSPGSTATELSHHDAGRLAEVDVLARQLREAKAKGDAKLVAELQRDAYDLVNHLGTGSESAAARTAEQVKRYARDNPALADVPTHLAELRVEARQAAAAWNAGPDAARYDAAETSKQATKARRRVARPHSSASTSRPSSSARSRTWG